MRLYGAIQKVEPQDDGTVWVYGIATSEAVDEQGEIVRADAMRAAIPEYMRFPALREMHQLSAAGTTLEAEVGDDGATRIVARVVDPVAVSKVKNQVYRGFSIGGRVTQREAANPKTITGLILSEISLVDRPANPAAVFDCWKAAMAAIDPSVSANHECGTDLAAALARNSLAQEPFNAPIQIWSCGVPAHRHLAKAEALKCMSTGADSARDVRAAGFSSATTAFGEGVKTDAETEDRNRSMPVNLAKDISGDASMARMMPEFDRLRTELETMSSAAHDDSPSPQRILDVVSEVCQLLSALIAGGDGDSESKDGTDPGIPTSQMTAMYGADDGAAVGKEAFPQGSRADLQTVDTYFVKARHSRGDQAMLDMARLACDQCLMITGLSADESAALSRALENLLCAGAGSGGLAAGLPADDENDSSISPSPPASDGPDADVVNEAATATERMGKRDRAHQNLMDLAHACLQTLTDGAVCDGAMKIGARHSQASLRLIKASHDHLLAAGALCEPRGPAMQDTPLQSALETELGMAVKSHAAGEHSEPAALAKILGQIVPIIERLSRRVDEIARTPLPPLTIAKGTVAVSKQQDRDSDFRDGQPELSQGAIAAALAKMSKEEQTLTLIKASYAAPIRIPGSTVDPR